MNLAASYRIIVPVALLTMQLFSGCARRQPAIETLPLPDLRELISRMDRNRENLRDFTGAGSLEMLGSEVRKTIVGVRVAYLTPNFLSVKLKGTLGVNLGSLILAGDRYSLRSNADHQQTRGDITDFEYPLGLDILIQGEDVRDLFRPLIESDSLAETAKLSKDFSTQLYELAWFDEGIENRLWADPFRPVFIRELVCADSGDTIWYREVDGIKQHSGVFLPHVWTTRLGQAPEVFQIKLNLSQMQVNSGLTPADFEIEEDSPEADSG